MATRPDQTSPSWFGGHCSFLSSDTAISLQPGKRVPDCIKGTEWGDPLSTVTILSIRSARRSMCVVEGGACDAPWRKVTSLLIKKSLYITPHWYRSQHWMMNFLLTVSSLLCALNSSHLHDFPPNLSFDWSVQRHCHITMIKVWQCDKSRRVWL